MRGTHPVGVPLCLWSVPFSLWSLVFLFSRSPVRGWTAISLSSSGCARVSWALVFGWTSVYCSSPEPCCHGRRGRASQVPGRSARGPETAPTGRSARLLPRPPSERAGLRHVQARGVSSVTTQEGLKERSPRGTTHHREVATPICFHWVLCKCLWEAPSPLK